MKIARIFPRRLNATPNDKLAFVGFPPLFLPSVDEVHVSCAFTWDKPYAELIARAWRNCGYKVKIGGPAYNAPAGKFVPGRYVKPGITITSRGCIRRCPFCFVPRREGNLTLLDISPGWDIFDNNLLACPRPHIEAVLDMLEEQSKAARFTGGIDPRLCRLWFVKRLRQMRVQILYTAYDTPSMKTHTERTIKMLRNEGLSQRQVGCYVLVGNEGDTTECAETRLEWVFRIGGTPFAMFFRPPDDLRFKIPLAWHAIVRAWSRPAIIFSSHNSKANNCGPDIFKAAKEKK